MPDVTAFDLIRRRDGRGGALGVRGEVALFLYYDDDAIADGGAGRAGAEGGDAFNY